jgi:putative DNA primase/helicase
MSDDLKKRRAKLTAYSDIPEEREESSGDSSMTNLVEIDFVVPDDLPDPVRIVPPPGDPMRVARQFVAEHYADERGARLVHHRGGFYAWAGTHWPEGEDRRVRSDVYRWLETAFYWKPVKDKPPELVPFEPTKMKVANVTEALQAVVHIDGRTDAPTWLDHDEHVTATEIVAMENGLLHLPTRTLLEHTPALFNEHALPFEFNPEARPPERWLRFLHELWEDDDESIATVQELFGYSLSGDTSLQKIFCLVGPKRAGKGTIARVLQGLHGAHNVAGPTLSSLTHNFGLAPLIAKPLAVISDARLGTRSDSSIAVERLLSISGEDTLTVDVKYRAAWTGRLPTRILVLTNELPELRDSSGALASRFVLLVLTRSFYGHENPKLTEELLAGASGILNWSLEGLDRLRERGHFLQPKTSHEALRNLEDLASPIGAFVRDRCTVAPDAEVAKDALWAAWKEWCDFEGKARPGTRAVLIRDLRAAVPGIKLRRPRIDGERVYTIVGLTVNQTPDTPDQEDREQDESTESLPPNARRSGVSGVPSTVGVTNSDGDPSTRSGVSGVASTVGVGNPDGNGPLREQDAGRFADEQAELFSGRLEDIRRAAEEGRLQ